MNATITILKKKDNPVKTSLHGTNTKSTRIFARIENMNGGRILIYTEDKKPVGVFTHLSKSGLFVFNKMTNRKLTSKAFMAIDCKGIESRFESVLIKKL